MNCFWGHDWEKWKETDSGDLIETDFLHFGTKRKVGIWMTQERVCKRCNKKEIDAQREMI